MSIMQRTHSPARNALLLGTALALPLLAGTGAHAQQDAQQDTCLLLEQQVGLVDFDATDWTEDEVIIVTQSGDAAECQVWLDQLQTVSTEVGTVTETEQARVSLQDEVVIEGRVIVDQQPPQIEIEEQPAEVALGSITPDIDITEGQGEIIIRQAAPRITFDMPQPTIMIEQSAPEIIITMPDPDVAVSNMRPTVEVRQAEPRVSLMMAEPQVELELYQAENAETSPGIAIENRQAGVAGGDGSVPDAEVTLRRAEAQVTFADEAEGGGMANVRIERSQPVVRFEQADAEVEIRSGGEPQITWTQVGEATVTVQQAGEQAGEQGQQQAGQDQTRQQQAAGGAADDAMGGGPRVAREGFVEVVEVDAAALHGATLYGVVGEQIEQIGQISYDADLATDIAVDVGGFLGTQSREVLIPFHDLTILQSDDGADLRVYVAASEDRLATYPEALR